MSHLLAECMTTFSEATAPRETFTSCQTSLTIQRKRRHDPLTSLTSQSNHPTRHLSRFLHRNQADFHKLPHLIAELKYTALVQELQHLLNLHEYQQLNYQGAQLWAAPHCTRCYTNLEGRLPKPALAQAARALSTEGLRLDFLSPEVITT